MNTPNMVFVFGSNRSGIHGAGAAKTAYRVHGAIWGIDFGKTGNSFAIPTKDKNIARTLPLWQIEIYVDAFIGYAKGHPELEFQVTRIGCGLAGLKDKDIALMFLNSPDNCHFDEKWVAWLGTQRNYWGTYD